MEKDFIILQDFSTKYRIEIKNSKDAEEQYTLLKALYVISNETSLLEESIARP